MDVFIVISPGTTLIIQIIWIITPVNPCIRPENAEIVASLLTRAQVYMGV